MRVTSAAALSAAFLLIFGSAVAVAGLTYPAKAAAMPLLVGGAGAALSLLQLVAELRAGRHAGPDPVDLARDLPIYGWVWIFIAGVVGFGFLIAPPILLLAYLRLRSRERWGVCLALPLAVLALFYGLFQVALGVDLFEGLVPPLVADWLPPS